MARGLARDLGPRDITINVIQPGPTDTDMNPADGPRARPACSSRWQSSAMAPPTRSRA
ncbi:SDR family oxidoreductase [Mesorhizobium sanjuanii]|uniref:SDR family oxidoreductase n=1 Tax=Mesorhizobium sanjuanii TaxID=2037900 RepID=UPI001FE11672|nr:SDR family oxidoreductase [Mesorhizobium sanjuanii]